MTDPRPPRVVVVVPARNERRRILACLRSVLVAAQRFGAERCDVVVVAHRCRDDTADLAAGILGSDQVLIDEASTAIGAVRDAGVRLALNRVEDPADRTWVLNTDADTTVPTDWMTGLVHSAAAAVAGVVRLDGDHPLTPAAQRRYRAVVRQGRRRVGHGHVYGANLAVRADAYLDVGGFPHLASGEDAALVEALEDRGWPVVRTMTPVVQTSSRRTGRAPAGLAAVLREVSGCAGAGAGPE